MRTLDGNSSKASVAVFGSLLCAILPCIAGVALFFTSCQNGQPTVATRPDSKAILNPNLIATAPEIDASWSTWWQNSSHLDFNGSSCTNDGCTNSYWTAHDTGEDCEYLHLFRWYGSSRGQRLKSRSYIAIDFDTRDIPTSATINSSTPKLYFKEGWPESDRTTEPVSRSSRRRSSRATTAASRSRSRPGTDLQARHGRIWT